MRQYLDFEKPIAELEAKIEELRRMPSSGDISIADEVAKLSAKADAQLRATYAKLTPWQKTLVARHPDRPKALDYVRHLIADYTPLAGDRAFAEDAAIIGGLGLVPGILAGLGVSFLINRAMVSAFGHTISFTPHPLLLLSGFLVGFVIVVFPAAFPAERAARLELVTALQYE